jgi:hypothetical protein
LPDYPVIPYPGFAIGFAADFSLLIRGIDDKSLLEGA